MKSAAGEGGGGGPLASPTRDDSLCLDAEALDSESHRLAGPKIDWRLESQAYTRRRAGGDDIPRAEAT